jgi:hypothetical protein
MKNLIDCFSLNSILRYPLVLIVLLGLFLNCSSTPKSLKASRDAVKEAYELQKPIVVKSSKNDDRPEWTKKSSFEKDGTIHFSGGFLNGSDYSVSVRCANAEALKVAAQSISQYIRSEFSEYAQGFNTGADGVERYVEDGIAVFVDNLHIQGIKQKEVYYEETFSALIMQPTYNVFVMLEIPKADYLKTKSDVLRKLRNKLSKENEYEAKEKAEKLLEDLKKEIQSEI